MNLLEWISQPWHWSVSGLAIALIMFAMVFLGERFGISSSFQTICTIGGAKRWGGYFDFDWRKNDWLLVFVLGTIIGGAIAATIMGSADSVQISTATVSDLQKLGVMTPENTSSSGGFLPDNLFSLDNLMSFQGIIIIIGGGFLVGFGARYAGGCTSGHAISGLSNLQLPSLVAVIGFFIGGLLMTHLFLPFILSL
ncbi:MAG: YeeE/YedE thiosulfate transporter family protein [Saprospiraceae bacterium]